MTLNHSIHLVCLSRCHSVYSNDSHCVPVMMIMMMAAAIGGSVCPLSQRACCIHSKELNSHHRMG